MQYGGHSSWVCGVSLGHFDFDVNVVVSKAVAADTGDSFPGETDPLVCLDACRNLDKQRKHVTQG